MQEIKALGSDAIAIKADVSNVNDTVRLFEEAVAHFGKLDIVSSNAGVVSFGHLEEVTPEEFDRVFNINTRGQFFVAREGYKHLNNGGRIILTSSNTARGFVVPKHAIYSGSKGSIESFVPVLAKDCGSKQITVNAVAPGGTVTDMFHDVAHHYIPGGEKMTIEQLKEVSFLFLFSCFQESLIHLLLLHEANFFFFSSARPLPMPLHSTDVVTLWMSLTPCVSSRAKRRNGSTEKCCLWMVVLLDLCNITIRPKKNKKKKIKDI